MELEKLMQTKKFLVIINLIRIGTFIMIGFLIWYMVKEVEAVKMLAYDSCKICMDKTGCNCWYMN